MLATRTARKRSTTRNAPCQPSYISVSGTVNSPAACLRSSRDVGKSAGMARRWASPPESPRSMVGGGAEPECLAHETPASLQLVGRASVVGRRSLSQSIPMPLLLLLLSLLLVQNSGSGSRVLESRGRLSRRSKNKRAV